MSKPLWKVLKISPAILGASLLLASSARAENNSVEVVASTSTLAASEVTVFPDAVFEGQLSPVEASTETEAASQAISLETLATAEEIVAESTSFQDNNDTSMTSGAIAQAVPSENSNLEVLEQINDYNNLGGSSSSLDQVTNVNQLTDVQPTDWAYEALRSLVERYGCIAGYPDGTYRGNRAMTRYEFAAGLNACLNQIERLIAAATADFVTREDLATLQRLIDDFQAELQALGARVDGLEARVAFLEDNQFSTTTKLNGEVLFTLANAFGDEGAEELLPDGTTQQQTNDIEDETTLSYRVRLAFDTSFTGRDRLRTRLEAGNFVSLRDEITGTDMTRLGHDADSGGAVEIEKLHYRFPVGDNLRFHVAATGLSFDDIASPNNPFLESSGSGALSRFARRNPFMYRTGGSAAFGANIGFGETFSLDLGYLTGGITDANDPNDGNGLFNGHWSARAQFNISLLDERLDIGLGGGYSFYPDGNVNLSGTTGSPISSDPFDGDAVGFATANVMASFQLAPTINISGWFGYGWAEEKDSDDDAELLNFFASVAFTDLLKEGSALVLGGGIPPRAIEVDGGPDDEDTAWHLEALYQFPISDNILITPGIYVILNPNHIDDNDAIFVGAIRTTFSF